jgi:hypothetical protein
VKTTRWNRPPSPSGKYRAGNLAIKARAESLFRWSVKELKRQTGSMANFSLASTLE